MAKDVADLVRKFQASADFIAPTVADQSLKGAQRTKVIYLAGAQRAGLTPGKKMNVGRNGARWGVRYDALKSSDAKEEILVKFTGPVHLVNGDTNPHVILTAAGRARQRELARQVIQRLTNTRIRRSRRSNGPMALALPSGPVASVKHPGTRGVARIVGDTHRIHLTRAGFGRN
jgi:hypothetical protein